MRVLGHLLEFDRILIKYVSKAHVAASSTHGSQWRDLDVFRGGARDEHSSLPPVLVFARFWFQVLRTWEELY